MKKLIKPFILYFIIFFVFYFIVVNFTKVSEKDFIGTWYYKETYLENNQLRYTEEDGFEQKIVIKKDHTYLYSDYTGDDPTKGHWSFKDDHIELKEEKESLYLHGKNKLKTNLKKKNKYIKQDYYLILIKK